MPYDGQDLRRMLEAARDAISRHIDEVNALNVFPVPDGDSGTNLTLTLQAATKALEGSEETHAGQVAAKAARGALLGARGNSGVIFSQILRGISKGLEGVERFDSAEFARALRSAREHAYKSVLEPVEGTILTVVREAAERAERVAATGASLVELFQETVTAAGEAVARTTDLLPVLKQAGVVDSAGKGLHYILDGMYRAVADGRLAGAAANGLAGAAGQAEARMEGEASQEYGFEVQFMIEGERLDVAAIRARVAEMGESVLVVGDETMVKVHVHTLDPDRVIAYANSLGDPQQLTLENLDQQAEAFREAHGGR